MHSIKELQNIFCDELKSFKLNSEPSGLNAPIEYILAIGGKRVRPVLVLSACEMFGGGVIGAFKPAMAIEVFHNFTLMHDDIMDEASIRRGKETVHKLYDVNTAILSGDVMLIYAYQLLEGLDGDLFKKIFRVFNKTAVKVCEGQRFDLNFESRLDVNIEEYIKMIEYKTAVLLGCSLEVGAYLGGSNDTDAKNMYEFGRNLGIAFQIQDDILDAFGDEEDFGKKIGGDIIQNKKTFLLIKSFDLAGNDERKELDYWLGQNGINNEEKITSVISLYNKLGINDEAERSKKVFMEKALSHLEQVKIDPERKKVLIEISDKLLNRNN